MSNWRTLTSELVYDGSPWLRVTKNCVQTPAGTKIDGWQTVELPSFVNVMARTRDGQFVVLQQDKYECSSLCAAGGLIDGDESPDVAARRELLEETGYQSEKWTLLGSYVIDPNRGCGRCHLFFADDAVKVGEATAPDLEQGAVLLLSEAELRDSLLSFEFKAIAWSHCVALTLLKLGKDRVE